MMYDRITILERISSFVMQHKTLLLVLCVIVVFRNILIEWTIKFVCPITSHVPENNIWVMQKEEILKNFPHMLANVGFLL